MFRPVGRGCGVRKHPLVAIKFHLMDCKRVLNLLKMIQNNMAMEVVLCLWLLHACMLLIPTLII